MFNLVILALLVQPVPIDFTVVSFNIRYDNPGDGESAWPRRAEWVAGEMRQADLIGVQEALRHQAGQLAVQLTGYDWVGIGRDDGKEAGEFAPIFFKTAVFELLSTSTFWLSETPDQPGSQGWDAALPRVATSAHLKVRGGNYDFYVINTHFDHRGIIARQQSAELLVEHIRKLNKPVLLLGDLNTTPDTDIFATLIRGGFLRDTYAVSEASPIGPSGTFSGFLENDRLNEAPRIDYILASPEWNVLTYEAVVSIQNGRYVSDHLPVKVQIRLPQ